MESLAARGINSDLCASEFERCLSRTLSTESLSSIRSAVFAEAQEAGLACEGDALVQRRKTNGGKSVKQKHVSDVWHLVCSIRNKTSVPRTLLRNGKRSKDELCISQARHQAVVDTSVGTHPLSHSPLVNRTSQPRADTSVGTRPLLHSP